MPGPSTCVQVMIQGVMCEIALTLHYRRICSHHTNWNQLSPKDTYIST